MSRRSNSTIYSNISWQLRLKLCNRKGGKFYKEIPSKLTSTPDAAEFIYTDFYKARSSRLYVLLSSFYCPSVANAPNVLQPYWLTVLPLDFPAVTASLLLWGPSGQSWRCLWTFFFSNVPTFATGRLQDILAAKGGTTWTRNSRWIFPENARLPHNIQGSFTCRKSTTWDRRLYFPSEGRRAEDFFALKNPKDPLGFEPANFGAKGQQATSRPSKTLDCTLHTDLYTVTTNTWASVPLWLPEVVCFVYKYCVNCLYNGGDSFSHVDFCWNFFVIQVLLKWSEEREITGPHTANWSCDSLQPYGWEVMNCPAYSPELDPWDLHKTSVRTAQ